MTIHVDNEPRATKRPYGSIPKFNAEQLILIETLKKYMGGCPLDMVNDFLDMTREISEDEIGKYFTKIVQETPEIYEEIKNNTACLYAGLLTGYAVYGHVKEMQIKYGELDDVAYVESFFRSTNHEEHIAYLLSVMCKFEATRLHDIFSFFAKYFLKHVVLVDITLPLLYDIGMCIGYQLGVKAEITKIERMYNSTTTTQNSIQN